MNHLEKYTFWNFNALFCLPEINLVTSKQRIALLHVNIATYDNYEAMHQPVFKNSIAKWETGNFLGFFMLW